MWWSKDNLQKPALAFYHVGLGTRTQASVLGSKHLYLLSPLTCPLLSFNQNSGCRSSKSSPYSGIIRSPFMEMDYIYQDNRFDILFKAS